MGTLKAAKLGTSQRLQSVFWLLSDGREHSTREIIRTCDRCAINSIASELRDTTVGNGLTIHRALRHDGAWWYRMELDDVYRSWRQRLIEMGRAAG